MLAQNFKTAAELGIPEVIHEGLIKVLGMMERGELRHVDITDFTEADEYDTKPELSGNFNMGVWCQPYENCGTVCCIGGAVDMLCDGRFDHNSPDLHNLFHPGVCGYEDITVEQAACATRNYLATGNADWDSILGT